MPFTTNLSGVTELDNSLVEAFDQQFIIAAAQEAVVDQFVSYKKDINAKAISFPKYNQIALATSALTETDDVTSSAMSDSEILLTPAEYGAAITRTALAQFQTGGRADMAAAKLVGINMARTLDKLALLAADGSSNVITPGDAAVAALAATDIMSVTLLNRAYNKLARASVQPLADGMYVAVMHDDVIYDLRDSSAAGSWQDINKYSSSVAVLKNEVGMLGGFRIVRDNHCTLTADEGAGAVDTYRTAFLGYNALGKAVSKEPGVVLSGPFDKLGRFVNVGWYGVLKYGIVDQDALWSGVTASSIGVNA